MEGTEYMGSISASTRDWKQPARDVFFIEGCYVSDKECEVMQGAMFVEHLYCPDEKKPQVPKLYSSMAAVKLRSIGSTLLTDGLAGPNTL
ncbi:hypothetical protein [Advenella mimigardefordensis]|uniref:hypothetical protein n=1 Tax=Advenella mimigardefordensis TaxID=302406 RepID=UPI000693A4C1|nr:hypothetical protein [Advenella mimigardefordensis]